MAAPSEKQRRGPVNKKRKSFLQNARGMGKKGKFGHGSQLDQETYDYYIRILELLRDDFDSPEERDSLVKNALIQTEEHEVDHCSNQVGSRAIESLVKLAPPCPALKRFMDVFAANMRVVATNRFASHVLQSLIAAVTKFGLDSLRKDSGDAVADQRSDEELTGEVANEWVLKVARFVLNNIDEFVWDEYANYVIRTVLLSLAGIPPSESNQTRPASQGSVPSVFLSTFVKTEEDEPQEEVSLPDGFSNLLKEYYKRLSSWPQFSELAYSNTTSVMLQTLLPALSRVHPKSKKKLIKQIIDQVFSVKTEKEDDKKDMETLVPPVFTTDASVRLLEAALEHASAKHVTQIYAMCFKGHIINLATDLATNFCVQRLLASIRDQSEFEEIFDELAPGMDKVLASGRSGVLLALCQACKRLSVKQGDFIQQLMNALNCMEPADRRASVTALCVRLCTYENYKATENSMASGPVAKDGVSKSKFSLHGTLIVQTMLHFKKPIKIVNSLLEMPNSELKSLMCDPKGCHIMDAFVKSEHVGEKSRERLLHRLLGSYVAMACSKHGSRALESLYAVSSLKNQMKIMEELASKEGLVTGTEVGRIIANKYALDLFNHRKNEWKQLQTRKERTKDMFADIIGPS